MNIRNQWKKVYGEEFNENRLFDEFSAEFRTGKSPKHGVFVAKREVSIFIFTLSHKIYLPYHLTEKKTFFLTQFRLIFGQLYCPPQTHFRFFRRV